MNLFHRTKRCDYMGDQQVLHHVQGRLSSRDLYGGYYGKSTACALRHESR